MPPRTPDSATGFATSGDPEQFTDQAVSNASEVILAANEARRSATIQNVGAANIRVSVDGTAATPTHGLQLQPGMSMSLDQPFVGTTDIKAIREGAADSAVSVVEVS